MPQDKYAVLNHIKQIVPPDVTPVYVGGDDLFHAAEHPSLKTMGGHTVISTPRNLPGEPDGGYSSTKVRRALRTGKSVDKYLHRSQKSREIWVRIGQQALILILIGD